MKNINPTYKEREVRALYSTNTITVYQAFNKTIAKSALKAQTFVSPPFKIERMTWIKPSFLWMMYRSGWAQKENQERILEIKIKREGFEWALQHACLSHYVHHIHENHETWKSQLQQSDVRIQWDPEKDLFLNALPYRSIQIGLHQEAVKKYINEWIVEIKDITEHCQSIHQFIQKGEIEIARNMLPKEELYPVPKHLAKQILM